MNTEDPAEILAALIRCPSVTPQEGGALRLLTSLLEPMGFSCERPVFSDSDTPDVENLYARLGTNGPHLMFAGHTDVVPPGDEDAWTHGPFAAETADGKLYGRGAVDMKGGIACFVAALSRHVAAHGMPRGSVSLLITGDEEGPSVNGTEKLLAHVAAKGEKWDASLVGEPTNPESMGDMIKIGRRGSLSANVTVHGVQGHVAYPHLADNPLRTVAAFAAALMEPPLDEGNERFPPSNLELTSIDTGNPAANVIPARAVMSLNIRFNDIWSVESLRAEIEKRLANAAASCAFRKNRPAPHYDLAFGERASPSFLTHDDRLIDSLAASIEAVTDQKPVLSTTGGTSDARFIKDYCPVVEFGLVGKTMHMVDEHVEIADLQTLTNVYQAFIAEWFGTDRER